MTWTLEMLQVVTFIRNLEDNSPYKKNAAMQKNNLHCCGAACIQQIRQRFLEDSYYDEYERYE